MPLLQYGRLDNEPRDGTTMKIHHHLFNVLWRSFPLPKPLFP